jgi:hypothetical protein
MMYLDSASHTRYVSINMVLMIGTLRSFAHENGKFLRVETPRARDNAYKHTIIVRSDGESLHIFPETVSRREGRFTNGHIERKDNQ